MVLMPEPIGRGEEVLGLPKSFMKIICFIAKRRIEKTHKKNNTHRKRKHKFDWILLKTDDYLRKPLAPAHCECRSHRQIHSLFITLSARGLEFVSFVCWLRDLSNIDVTNPMNFGLPIHRWFRGLKANHSRIASVFEEIRNRIANELMATAIHFNVTLELCWFAEMENRNSDGSDVIELTERKNRKKQVKTHLTTALRHWLIEMDILNLIHFIRPFVHLLVLPCTPRGESDQIKLYKYYIIFIWFCRFCCCRSVYLTDHCVKWGDIEKSMKWYIRCRTKRSVLSFLCNSIANHGIFIKLLILRSIVAGAVTMIVESFIWMLLRILCYFFILGGMEVAREIFL